MTEQRREYVDRCFDAIMDCSIALNNLLPGPKDHMLKSDKVVSLVELDQAYSKLVSFGFMDVDGDPYARSPIESNGVIASSYGRLICELSWTAIERVLSLVSQQPVTYDRYCRDILEADIQRLRKLPHAKISNAAGHNVNRAELERITELYCVEMDSLPGSRPAATTQPSSDLPNVETVLGQFNPDGRESLILIAMQELGAVDPSKRLSQQSILDKAFAGYANDNRRVFRKLEALGLILKGDNARGYYLSTLGIEAARRLSDRSSNRS